MPTPFDRGAIVWIPGGKRVLAWSKARVLKRNGGSTLCEICEGERDAGRQVWSRTAGIRTEPPPTTQA